MNSALSYSIILSFTRSNKVKDNQCTKLAEIIDQIHFCIIYWILCWSYVVDEMIQKHEKICLWEKAWWFNRNKKIFCKNRTVVLLHTLLWVSRWFACLFWPWEVWESTFLREFLAHLALTINNVEFCFLPILCFEKLTHGSDSCELFNVYCFDTSSQLRKCPWLAKSTL